MLPWLNPFPLIHRYELTHQPTGFPTVRRLTLVLSEAKRLPRFADYSIRAVIDGVLYALTPPTRGASDAPAVWPPAVFRFDELPENAQVRSAECILDWPLECIRDWPPFSSQWPGRFAKLPERALLPDVLPPDRPRVPPGHSSMRRRSASRPNPPLASVPHPPLGFPPNPPLASLPPSRRSASRPNPSLASLPSQTLSLVLSARASTASAVVRVFGRGGDAAGSERVISLRGANALPAADEWTFQISIDEIDENEPEQWQAFLPSAPVEGAAKAGELARPSENESDADGSSLHGSGHLGSLWGGGGAVGGGAASRISHVASGVASGMRRGSLTPGALPSVRRRGSSAFDSSLPQRPSTAPACHSARVPQRPLVSSRHHAPYRERACTQVRHRGISMRRASEASGGLPAAPPSIRLRLQQDQLRLRPLHLYAQPKPNRTSPNQTKPKQSEPNQSNLTGTRSSSRSSSRRRASSRPCSTRRPPSSASSSLRRSSTSSLPMAPRLSIAMRRPNCHRSPRVAPMAMSPMKCRLVPLAVTSQLS